MGTVGTAGEVGDASTLGAHGGSDRSAAGTGGTGGTGGTAREGRRTGIAIGAGGVLGAAWATGALCALQEVLGVRADRAEVLIGTSAGSVLTAMLAGGLSADHLRDHQRGLPLPEGLTVVWDHETGTGGFRPARPTRPPASRELIARAVREPGSVPWLTALWAALPAGSGSLSALHQAVEDLVGAGAWAPRPGVEIVATDFASGERVVFAGQGRSGTSLADAVVASCSAPLWYAPYRVQGRPYIDGGLASATSADLLAGRGLQDAYVLAPLATLHPDSPSDLPSRLERLWRRRTTRRVMAEVHRLAADGVRVTVLTPGPEDLQAMGANLMDNRRRLAVMETSLTTTEAALRRRCLEGAVAR